MTKAIDKKSLSPKERREENLERRMIREDVRRRRKHGHPKGR